MDRLNARLVVLVQTRARLAREIGAIKAELELPAASPEREREMLATLLRDAPPGFDRRELSLIFRTLFATSRRMVVRERRRRRA